MTAVAAPRAEMRIANTSLVRSERGTNFVAMLCLPSRCLACDVRTGYMASLIPARMSQVLTGQEVKKPAIMPICMRNQ
jgi:hypothetical protein